MLFRHHYDDTTNAFKAYRREVIETVQPLLANHFNLTVEIPLKAIVRGHSYGIVPISWHGRSSGASKLDLREMGSRYAFIVLYVLLERYMSRGDYLRPGLDPESDRAGPASGRGAPHSEPSPGGVRCAAHPRRPLARPRLRARRAQEPRDLGTGALLASASLAISYVAIGITSIAAARIVGANGTGVVALSNQIVLITVFVAGIGLRTSVAAMVGAGQWSVRGAVHRIVPAAFALGVVGGDRRIRPLPAAPRTPRCGDSRTRWRSR